MTNVSRLIGYIWPYRYRFFASIACAVSVAVLWCANIATFAPIMKALFENDSLHAYVDQRIETAEANIAKDTAFLAEVESVETRARIQARISDHTGTITTFSRIKDWVMPYIPRDKFYCVGIFVLFILFGTILKTGFIYVQEILIGSVVNHTANDIRRDCFYSAQKLDLQSAADEGTPNLISRMTNDIWQIMIAISSFGTKIIREPLKAAACVGAACYINWRLTLMAVVLVPITGVLLGRFGRLLKKAANNAMDSLANICDDISETFDNFRVVTAFGGQARQSRRFDESNNRVYAHLMKTIRVSALIRPTSEIMAVIIVCIAFTPGAYMVLRNTDTFFGIQLAHEAMTIVELMTFYVMLAGTLDPIRKMSSVFGQIKQGMVGADRAFELIDRASLIQEAPTAREMVRHRRSIAFEDISFRYAVFDGEESARLDALQNVDLKFQFDEVIAVVGTNGSGKSTLLSLLPRFCDPMSGRVTIDGIDIREFKTEDLRSQIGLVNQETMLFDDTVLENIRYGCFDADEATVEAAAKKAHAWDFIQELPEKLGTGIGPGGRKLSGGQRQRIALARAIIRDPSILILDEATSAVDAESEDMIHGVLKDFSKERTVFIITHALSETFLDLVDRIVVMDQGQVAAVGNHNQLLQTCEIYQRLSQAGMQQKAAA